VGRSPRTLPVSGGPSAGKRVGIYLHDVPGSRDAGRPLRVPVPVAPAGVREYPEDIRLIPNDIGFLLAVASRRWNELLERRFAAGGFPEVRASYGALLVPLFEEDGLRMGELGRRARLSKQTVTTMARLLERDGLVERRPDPADARATRVFLSGRGAS